MSAPNLTQEQKDKIVALYKTGKTFRDASHHMPREADNFDFNQGAYAAVAALGHLSDEQARGFLRQSCDPPSKGKCNWALQYVADQINREEGLHLKLEEVRTILNEALF